MLAETVSGLCRDVLEGLDPSDDDEGITRELRLWSALQDLGIMGIGVSEEDGGSGGSLRDAALVLRVLGQWGVSTPMAEAGLMTAMNARGSNLRVDEGLCIPAVIDESEQHVDVLIDDDAHVLRLDGVLTGVPWARHASELLLLIPDSGSHQELRIRAPRQAWTVSASHNLAGEPRDDIVFSGEGIGLGFERAAPGNVPSDELSAWGAFARSAQICGAMGGILNLCTEYAANRRQFNKPLIAFQAIQHYVALIANEVVMANAALELATCLADSEHGIFVASALAKTRMSTAAGKVARLAHQVHGAIGFTREYSLQRYTRRLWCWRDDYGNERLWATRLGKWASQGDVWELLTSVP